MTELKTAAQKELAELIELSIELSIELKTATLADLAAPLVWENSYSRLPILLGLYYPMAWAGRRSDWLRLLGHYWSICDNISLYFDDLCLRLLYEGAEEGPVVEMMDAAELAAWHALPDLVTVYRGAGKDNRHGASWSLSEEVARTFPLLNRYWQKVPMLYTAEVRKQDILALKLDRDEQEVITFNARIVKSRRIGRKQEVRHD
jgi:hypothetical protein